MGSHLVSLVGSKGRKEEGIAILGACQWCSCRPSRGSSSRDLTKSNLSLVPTKNNPSLVPNKNWALTSCPGLTQNLSPISRAGQKTWGTFATSRQEEPGW